MSFSSEVKEELAKHNGSSRHCQLAELAAIISCVGDITIENGVAIGLSLQTDNQLVIRKFFTLLKKAFNIRDDKSALDSPDHIASVLKAVKMIENEGRVRDISEGVSPMITRNSCCKRAFLRDSFLCVGSISDPNKGYHLEYVCNYEAQALYIQQLIESFEIEARIVRRKKYYVVYVKEGAGIVDLLNIMEAPVSLMNLENLRIVKEMRNSINRRVNCEVANITKTVNAATKQIEDITYIRDHYGFSKLQESLRDMAEVRLEHPDATLSELGKFLDPPVGKSGVNHRLRKLSELADKIRS